MVKTTQTMDDSFLLQNLPALDRHNQQIALGLTFLGLWVIQSLLEGLIKVRIER